MPKTKRHSHPTHPTALQRWKSVKRSATTIIDDLKEIVIRMALFLLVVLSLILLISAHVRDGRTSSKPCCCHHGAKAAVVQVREPQACVRK